VTAGGCPLPLAPLCDVAGGAASSVAGGVLSAIVGWIVAGAKWLLDQIGGALSSSTSVDVGASWFHVHYAAMGAIAAVVAVPLLVLAAAQAVLHQSPALVARAALVQVPLAAVLSVVAVKVVSLSLEVTDSLSSAVSASTGEGISRALGAVAEALVSQAAGPNAAPPFVVGLGALVVVAGALVLWLELIVRAAAVYVAVLFLPLALATLVWPALSHWCRRLVETLAAIILSKFVVVAILSLAVGAVGSGHGFATVLSGGALLLLASFTPFTLLRLVPLIEAGAALQLEGARHRVRQSWGSVPASAAAFALRQVRDRSGTPGRPGTGTSVDPGLPGGDLDGGGGTGGGSGGGGSGGGVGPRGGGHGGGGGDEDDGAARWGGPGEPSGPPPGPLALGDPGSKREVAAELFARMRGTPDSFGGITSGVDRPTWGGQDVAPTRGLAAGGREALPPLQSRGPGPAVGRDEMGPVLRWQGGAFEGAAGGASGGLAGEEEVGSEAWLGFDDAGPWLGAVDRLGGGRDG
jgi:hypothetical protein